MVISLFPRSKWTRWLISPVIAGLIFAGVLPMQPGFAQTPSIQDQARALAREKGLESLRTAITQAGAQGKPLVLNPSAKVPLPPDLEAFLNPNNPNARKIATQLGKALFWDMAIGSDGQSCASCHFHAGADNRIKNQLSPDLTRVEDARQGDIKGFHFAKGAEDLEFQLVGNGLGPNYTLTKDDFPFTKDIGSADKNGQNVAIGTTISQDTGKTVSTVFPVAPNTNDVASSQGVFWTQFQSVVQPNEFNPFALVGDPSVDGNKVPIRDKGMPQADPKGFLVKAPDGAFTLNQTDPAVNVRRVEPRNTPSAVNAVFNLHNFWDGRANFNFNGVNPFGKTDPSARIFVRSSTFGRMVPRQINMSFASLASQAVGPPLSNFEMSFDGRIWPDIGKKMLSRKLLAQQTVDPNDSLLGELLAANGPATETGKGINVVYSDLIKESFHPKFWSDTKHRVFLGGSSVRAPQPNNPIFQQGTPEVIGAAKALAQAATGVLPSERIFTQMEANFSFFFGVAVMLYEAELVSDQSKFDLWMEGKETLTDSELLGLLVFIGKSIPGTPFANVTDGKCINCHGGPEFSNATVRNTQAGANLVEPMLMGDGQPAFYDNGFYNIGVTPTPDDLGRGGKGPRNKPLSSSRQFLFKDQRIDSINFPIIGLPIKDLVQNGVHPRLRRPILRDPVSNIDVCVDLDRNRVCTERDIILIPRVAVDGAFKTPQLRNIELTGPYWHNGGFLTLMQVVEFYDDGGHFCKFNFDDLDPDIQPLGMTPEERNGLVAFLLALTDERVRTKTAPFDHPELRIPDGHPDDEATTTADPLFDNGAGKKFQAEDIVLTLDPVGKNGTTNPLKPFHTQLDDLMDHFDPGIPVQNVPCSKGPRTIQ